MQEILNWDVYEITSKKSSIQGVMLRGCIRKFSLKQNIALLTENASDLDNAVRFAILNKENSDEVISFIKSIVPDSKIILIQENLPNPVLSKMKVNKEERYTL